VDDGEVRERVARLEEELGRLEDPAALEAVGGLVELYGEALRRVGERIPLEQLVEDELLAHLLLVHDLHPVEVENRVRRGLDEVRPYLGSHGGGVELLGVEEGVARLRLEGTCNGCPSSAVTLRNAIEEAVLRAAPELERIEAEGASEPQGAQPLLQIQPLVCPTELQSA
jgi:Fe-S cluster biogenesis protein NfuA